MGMAAFLLGLGCLNRESESQRFKSQSAREIATKIASGSVETRVEVATEITVI